MPSELCMLDIFSVPNGFNIHKTSDALEHMAGVDLKEFHDMDFIFNHLNDVYSLNISYFSDEIIKTDGISILMSMTEESNLSNHIKAKWNKITSSALKNNKWLFFVAD